MNPEAINQGLEMAGERSADPTALVHERLFAAQPETEALFVSDTDGSVRGQMLYLVLEAVLNDIGGRQFARGMISAEVVKH
jgi:hypothetical protein